MSKIQYCKELGKGPSYFYFVCIFLQKCSFAIVRNHPPICCQWYKIKAYIIAWCKQDQTPGRKKVMFSLSYKSQVMSV